MNADDFYKYKELELDFTKGNPSSNLGFEITEHNNVMQEFILVIMLSHT